MDGASISEYPYFKQGKQYLFFFKQRIRDEDDLIAVSPDDKPLATCITDAYGYILQVNKAFCSFYGYKLEELIGKHFTIIAPSESQQKLTEIYDKVSKGIQKITVPWAFETKAGKQIDMRATANYIQAAGRSEKTTVVIDINENKQCTSRPNTDIIALKRLISAQNTAFEILLHDLKGPVGNMMSMAEFLNDKTVKNAEKEKIIEKVAVSAKKAYYLTERLSTLVRFEANNYQPKPQSFDITELINGIWSEVLPQAEAKKVCLVMRPIKSMITTDSFLLNLALSNLLKNAVEASPPNQPVSIHIDNSSTCVISIHNFGIIPAAIRGNFFNKYVTYRKASGSGIGTYLAKKAINLLDGEISFRTSEAEGTSLVIRFLKETVPENPDNDILSVPTV